MIDDDLSSFNPCCLGLAVLAIAGAVDSGIN